MELALVVATLSNICFHALALFCAVPGVAVGTPVKATFCALGKSNPKQSEMKTAH